MKKYVCETCGYVYDPEVGDPDNGVAPGTAFEDLPKTGFARFVALERMNSLLKNNSCAEFR